MRQSVARLAALALLSWISCFAVLAPRAAHAQPVVVDDFDDVSGWSAHPADGVDLAIGRDTGELGGAMRLDFRFHGGGGYAVARKTFAVDLPDNYAFTFRMRGEALSNHVEFKLIDASGENVWWHVRRDVEFSREWQTVTIKRRQIQFAWGPQGGGEMRHVAAIEFAITAGSGGDGSVWIDRLELKPLASPGAEIAPVATASSEAPGHPAAHALDGDSTTAWRCGPADVAPWITLDLGTPREFGGFVINWESNRHPPRYEILLSEDGGAWQSVRPSVEGMGGRNYVYLPESEARFIQIRAWRTPGPANVAINEFSIKPLEWSATRAAFFEAIARDARRGHYPRGMSGEMSYWTVVGADDDAREGLLSEDGALETGKGAFSIEPFLSIDKRLITWNDVRIDHALEDGSLPIPSVTWHAESLNMTVTAAAVGRSAASALYGRYRLSNLTALPVRTTLYLALRPFQVNPPAQFLNMPGGTAPIDQLDYADGVCTVNRTTRVVSLSGEPRFGAATFDQGDVVQEYLARGVLPEASHVLDTFGAASGALAYDLEVPAHGEREIAILVPLYERTPAAALDAGAAAARWADVALARMEASWKEKLERVQITLPGDGAELVRTLKAQLAYILVNRAGVAIQPGTRSYARSWIRDGALTSSALLRLGHEDAAVQFAEWFAKHQYANGKAPCCIDSRGADPVPEHDSSGELIFLIAECYRYTRDDQFLDRMWPNVLGAVAYLDSLRNERRTDEYRAPERAEFFGLLPPSISHEGYSAKPMHSYWDDLFALRGFRDAAFLADARDDIRERDRIGMIYAEFKNDLLASIAAAMKRHNIDYIPGCADLGDFDATSTAIAFTAAGAGGILPHDALAKTFEKYHEFFTARRDGAPWEAFTPYEIRVAGALVRMGEVERAHEYLDYFLDYRRPEAWAQWGEVVWRGEREAKFIGDMPHTWVGSEFIRAVVEMLAYHDEDREAIVIGAGLTQAWLSAEGGVAIRNLRTPFGPLSYSARTEEAATRVQIERGVRVPWGGIALRLPKDGPLGAVTVNGVATPRMASGEIIVRDLPATIIVRSE
ncbi:MAG: discoidin domain-containing protein [bacterium]